MGFNKRLEREVIVGMLEIEVVEVRGYCPVYKVGDRIVIEGPRIVLEKTDALCIHALSVLLHYAVALDEDADRVKLGSKA